MNQNSSYHQTETQIQAEERILKAAIDNPAAFGPIYEKYYIQLFRYTLQRVDNELIAAEIVSDVFAKAIYNLPKYKFKGYPFGAWLYRVAFNEITNLHRKNKITRTVNIPLDQIEELDNDSEFLELKEVGLLKLKDCLKKLSQEELEYIELRFFEERPYKEMGEILNITTDHARVKTHRIVTKLKKLFKL